MHTNLADAKEASTSTNSLEFRGIPSPEEDLVGFSLRSTRKPLVFAAGPLAESKDPFALPYDDELPRIDEASIDRMAKEISDSQVVPPPRRKAASHANAGIGVDSEQARYGKWQDDGSIGVQGRSRWAGKKREESPMTQESLIGDSTHVSDKGTSRQSVGLQRVHSMAREVEPASRSHPDHVVTWLLLEITDTGIGIAASAARQLFEPFQ